MSFAFALVDVEIVRDVGFLNDEDLDREGFTGWEDFGDECWDGFVVKDADEEEEMAELLRKEEVKDVEEAREVKEVEDVEERIEEDMVWSW